MHATPVADVLDSPTRRQVILTEVQAEISKRIGGVDTPAPTRELTRSLVRDQRRNCIAHRKASVSPAR